MKDKTVMFKTVIYFKTNAILITFVNPLHFQKPNLMDAYFISC